MRSGALRAMALVGVVAVTGASAKDLPRGRAEHRATGCEQYGPGFVKLDGSDTCVKVGGGVRAETSIISSGGGLTARPTR